VYVASSKSDAIAVFKRNAKTGVLTQAGGSAGCISQGAVGGCANGAGLDGPNSVAVSPDGENVYVGAFFGSAIATFDRDPQSGALVQPPGPTGCITNIPDPGCVNGRAMAAIEGLAISEDGLSVYGAAAGSNALVILDRDPATGALSQASDGTGCITQSATTDCTQGRELSGANAVDVSPGDETVYVTSLFSNSVTTFARAPGSGDLTQLDGTAGCLVYLVAIGCRLGQAMEAPEGLGLSPDGRSLYVASFESGAVDVLNRDTDDGEVAQKTLKAGCVAIRVQRNCRRGRRLVGASSAAVSPDGKSLYVTAFGSDAVGVFERKVAK
jgi:DNA-binding beta-propeller fold protein YncE